ncbi:alpha-tubulin suppressor protein Aats1 [Aspergillus eucalypticola CBS 122712]|uniref:Alpha-tubulin suppressor protein Aats1 n=1 Tax=Aspergillus eucalypticola (strain CBS 122712 / IBT 29274) TaxID=1448314 RepID=A0A317VGJ9_ASPEC|nr:alpha-tubulin suppressor protein Aats1 [Aspergillus eucalypticola CBS 122712]PWY72052.1 alpha-tubulin suppressor protein Aats1 [Aspergillus eucalypticola CBS 122712]
MPLYAFGSNGSGQLGLSHTEDVSVPTKCLFDDDQYHTTTASSSSCSITPTISRIAAGGNHTLVLFSDGRVYAAGCNEDGRCGGRLPSGSGDGYEEVVRFRRVVVNTSDGDVGEEEEERFTDVSATWEATFLVSGRKVYVLGTGGRGELGVGEGKSSVKEGVGCIEFEDKVISIASGMGHTVVVLEGGQVYGWGGGRKGQLGAKGKEIKVAWEPVRIDEEEIGFRATGAACGREFTVVLGDKEKGQFVVLGSPGDKWGVMSGGKEPVGCFQVAAGGDGVVKGLAVGSEHVLGLVDGTTVVACGWGEHGNCGPETDAQGNVKGVCCQIPLPDGVGEVVGLGAGCATSWVITRD